MNGANCNRTTGQCECLPGWRGESSNDVSACLKGYFGRHCSQTCRCSNQKPCDHITGKCQCPKGYTGHGCTELCPEGTYGEGCKKKCECNDNSDCDPISGKCYCKLGYFGEDCKSGEFCIFPL
ncbi:unnamed protein product [Strongylus vulgaris]|uniref:EGF-like domain-containing protein n=1 Tax=Strongylus vulgaris TaxID=40348 RepID=A0A3P7K064_STRVU|nr:unnamed protein product [Strongylus vulgaris]